MKLTIIFANKTPPLPSRPRQSSAPPVDLPIDGGITFLLISGLAFGVYKLKSKKIITFLVILQHIFQ